MDRYKHLGHQQISPTNLALNSNQEDFWFTINGEKKNKRRKSWLSNQNHQRYTNISYRQVTRYAYEETQKKSKPDQAMRLGKQSLKD